MPGIPTIETYRMPSGTQLPPNIAPWSIAPERAVLLVHDMQKFFVGKIPPAGAGDTLIDNAIALRTRCREADVPVAYTAQQGEMTAKQRGLLKDFWGAGMKMDPADRNVVDGLAPTPGDWSLTKWRYSAFFASDLLERMRASRRDQLVICGVYAHIGVLATAVEAFSNDIETFIVADAIADFSLERHLMALSYAASCCAVIVSTNEVVFT